MKPDIQPEELDLAAKLEQADPEVRQYVSALKAENLKLQRKIARLQAEHVTKDNTIARLEQHEGEELDACKKKIARLGVEVINLRGKVGSG